MRSRIILQGDTRPAGRGEAVAGRPLLQVEIVLGQAEGDEDLDAAFNLLKVFTGPNNQVEEGGWGPGGLKLGEPSQEGDLGEVYLVDGRARTRARERWAA